MIRKNTILQQFKEQNLRLTNSRLTLVEQFINASRPLSYDDCKDAIEMDKATFYRNMNTFETAGLIRRIESDDRKWYFEISTNVHAHFICSRCHLIECLEPLPSSPSMKGYSIDTVIYKGTCPSCNA